MQTTWAVGQKHDLAHEKFPGQKLSNYYILLFRGDDITNLRKILLKTINTKFV